MTSRANWQVVPGSIADEPESRLFFSEHEWATIEAATARIYPSDDVPGAREAKAVRFIDRYLSGLDYIFASADGSGFLQIGGKDAEAWGIRVEKLQRKYRDGIRRMDDISMGAFHARFRHLEEEQQDRVLEILSGAPKPTAVRVAETGEVHVQNISDDALDFFSALALHTRQGTFCDPVYGGNAGRVGWAAIEFPGPESLVATQDCTYGHKDKFLTDFDWADLIPHLRNKAD
jgi:gluconate 2-dehydrogenase gamma chain